MIARSPTRRQGAAAARCRDTLRRRTLEVLGRTGVLTSAVSLATVLAIDLLCRPAGPWMQVSLLALAAAYGLIAWSCRARTRTASARLRTQHRYGLGVAACAALGCLWATVILLTRSRPDRPLHDLLVPGLAYGAVLIAPMRGGALLFTAIVAAAGMLSELPVGVAETDLRLLDLFYGLTAGAMIMWQHNEFARSTANGTQLEEQSEIIGILLHDFEEQGSDWLWETDAELRLRAPSERLQDAVGCRGRRLTDLSLRRWIRARLRHTPGHMEGFARLVDCIERRSAFRAICIPVGSGDKERWLKLTGKPVFAADGSFGGYRGVGSDITEARRSQQRVEWLACHDSLTALPNRAHFHTRLHQACAEQQAGGPRLTLLCLDLDGFKTINDTLGHLAGDALLVQVAARLRSCIRDRDMIGRLGGDEFALLMVDGDEAGASVLAHRLLAVISEPYELNGAVTRIGASIGIMMAPDGGLDAPILLKNADLAMYQAKQEGRGTVCLFDPAMRDEAEGRLRLQTDLRTAIADEQLMLHFQPILNALSGRVVAAEALVRWLHPERGLIPPIDFIPIAEESGQICALGAWVLKQACREATYWPDEISISVNLSPVQLRDPALCAIVELALAESGLPPDRLELEITESLFLENNQAIRAALSSLKQRGIRIALDDFGTGFSSLSYLRDFPVDTVKIDRSFVRDLGADLDADMIVQAIAAMANGLGITITAEGVETADQAMRLRASGCTQFQGFLYSRPCAGDAVMRFMAAQNTTSLEIEPCLALEASANRPVPVSA